MVQLVKGDVRKVRLEPQRQRVQPRAERHHLARPFAQRRPDGFLDVPFPDEDVQVRPRDEAVRQPVEEASGGAPLPEGELDAPA